MPRARSDRTNRVISHRSAVHGPYLCARAVQASSPSVVAPRSTPGYRAGMSMELVREVESVSLTTQRHYIIKRKFWSFLERIFRVWTGDGQLIMYIKHPILRLREEFMVYEDEAQTRPLLRVKSKQVIAINFAYEITDAIT